MKESGGGGLKLRQSPEEMEMRLTFKGDNAKGKSERVTRSCSNIVTKVFPDRLLLPGQRQTILVQVSENRIGVDPISWGRTVSKMLQKLALQLKLLHLQTPTRGRTSASRLPAGGMLLHFTSGIHRKEVKPKESYLR